MSFEHSAFHNSITSCLDLCEIIQHRFAPDQKRGCDFASLQRIAKDAIMRGDLIAPGPSAYTADEIIRRNNYLAEAELRRKRRLLLPTKLHGNTGKVRGEKKHKSVWTPEAREAHGKRVRERAKAK